MLKINRKDKVLETHGATKIKEIKGINAVVVWVDGLGDFEAEESIRFVEDDVIVSISGKVKEDVAINSPKKKDESNQIPKQPLEVIPWGVEYVGAPEMWKTTRGEGIKVAIIDTGVDIDHPDLIDNIKGGTNTILKKGTYDDDNGHGTHVTGIIGAVDNDIGVIGVAPEVDLYAVKALDSNGNGYVSDVIEGIEWCITNDVNIVNMSISMISDSIALHETVVRAYNLGIVMVAAAGNNYGGACEYPAAYEEVIGVGAIDISGNISLFSAFEYYLYLEGEIIENNSLSK